MIDTHESHCPLKGVYAGQNRQSQTLLSSGTARFSGWSVSVIIFESLATTFLQNRVSVSAPLAQLDRASGYEPEGREFESLRAHHIFPLHHNDFGVCLNIESWGTQGDNFDAKANSHALGNGLAKLHILSELCIAISDSLVAVPNPEPK